MFEACCVHASNLRRSLISCSAAASGISLSSSAVGPMENGFFSSPGGDLRTRISFFFFFFHLPHPFISTRETPSGTHQPLTGAADLLSLDQSAIKPGAGGRGESRDHECESGRGVNRNVRGIFTRDVRQLQP